MTYFDSAHNIHFDNDQHYEWLTNQPWFTHLPRLDKALFCKQMEPKQDSQNGLTIYGQYAPVTRTLYITDPNETQFLSVFCHEWCHAFEMDLLSKHPTIDYRIGVFSELYEFVKSRNASINPFYYMAYQRDNCNLWFHDDLVKRENAMGINVFRVNLPQHEKNNPIPFLQWSVDGGYMALPNEIMARVMQRIPHVYNQHPEKRDSIIDWLVRISHYYSHGENPLTQSFNGLKENDMKAINTMYIELDRLEKECNIIDAAYSIVLFNQNKTGPSPLLNYKYDISPVHLRARWFNTIYQNYKKGVISEEGYREQIGAGFNG